MNYKLKSIVRDFLLLINVALRYRASHTFGQWSISILTSLKLCLRIRAPPISPSFHSKSLHDIQSNVALSVKYAMVCCHNYTVKPVWNDHPRCQDKVVFPGRWSFQRGRSRQVSLYISHFSKKACQ